MTPSAAPPPHSIQFFFDGDAFFEAGIQAIENAKEEILLEVYIYDMDRLGRRFIEALKKARARQVDVHIMVDGVGSLASLERLHLETEMHQIDFRVYHPPLFFSRLLHAKNNRSIGKWLRAFLNRLITMLYYINKRNHRKVLVVDREVAFLGSFNITEYHSRRYFGALAWRDTGVRVTSEATSLVPLVAAFQRAWLRSRDLDQPRWRFRRRVRGLKIPHLGLFRLNDTLRRRVRMGRELRQRLRKAKTRILITNAYFLPRPTLLRILRAAARRGVFVGLILPSKTDVWMVREAGRTMMRKLVKDGVQVFEYQPCILHAKTMVIDDWAMVGSHNLNYRSLIHDLEVDVCLNSYADVQTLVNQWDIDAKNSHSLTLSDLDQDSALRRLVGRLVYLVRYWM